MLRASGIDWSNHAFSVEKAHVCAELCSLVYNEVREHELKKASRIHLFASSEYRRIVESGSERSIIATLTETEFGRTSFVLASRYAVILGICLPDVVLVAIRGTAGLRPWDWSANIDTRKFAVFPHDGWLENEAYYHRGFFEAIVPQVPSVLDRISELSSRSDEVPIIWTGHSLGGAMAAIAHSMSRFNHRQMITRSFYNSLCAYTFGMPRYAGLGVVSFSPGPFHLFKRQDIVPAIPLRSMGFSDSTREFEISDDNHIELAERTDALGALGLLLRLRSGLAAHGIEGYAQSVADNLGVTRPLAAK